MIVVKILELQFFTLRQFSAKVGPAKEEDNDGEDEDETLEKWRLEKMEKEKWIQEFEKKQSRKRGYEEDEDVGGDDNESQFFKLADKTLMRMTSKDDSVNITSDAVTDQNQVAKVFKSPHAKLGPLQPLQNMVCQQLFLTNL